MQNSNISRFICALGLFGASCACADASTIQFSYGPVSVNFLGGGAVTQGFTAFDPALGTLSQVDISFTASAVLMQGNAISSHISIDDNTTLLDQISFPNMVGRAQKVVSGNFLVPQAVWADFETIGPVDLMFVPFTACRGSAPTPTGCAGFGASISGNITYTYTPTAPTSGTPEPATFALLGACVIVLGFVRVFHPFRRLPE
ncbi:MAG TPA: hypothetical protein VKB79_26650 [Bryobacteraceae bacterium]|nr:hypothetical protein [Bryobacteraceae bacterium]